MTESETLDYTFTNLKVIRNPSPGLMVKHSSPKTPNHQERTLGLPRNPIYLGHIPHIYDHNYPNQWYH